MKTLTIIAVIAFTTPMWLAALGCGAKQRARTNTLHRDLNRQTAPVCRGGLGGVVNAASGYGEAQVKILSMEGKTAKVINACGQYMTCTEDAPGSLYKWQCVHDRR